MKKLLIIVSVFIVLLLGSLYVYNLYMLNSFHKAFYTVKIKKSFKNAVFDLKQSIINDNYVIVAVNPISQGIKNVGKKISKLDVIEFCNLSYAYDFLHGNKKYAAFMPCRIAVYKEGDHVVMVGFLPSFALKFFKNNTPLAEKTALKVTRQMKSIINSVKNGF
jgi:uncharacterized protein (DUF302 family)